MTDKERDLIQKLAVDSALAGVAEGKRLERERIIKLIEDWWQNDETNHIELIALIKGDDK